MEKVPDKLTVMLDIIGKNLEENKIPHALIGSLALGFYGFPRYTSDIDILVPGGHWPRLLPLMKRLGYTCSLKNEAFAQFDSELGVYGRVDVTLVETDAGRQMLENSRTMNDNILGSRPVLQPTDFVILKLMAIANAPLRRQRDEADLISVLKLDRNGMIPDAFDPLDMNKIRQFAETFQQEKTLGACIESISQSETGMDYGEFKI